MGDIGTRNGKVVVDSVQGWAQQYELGVRVAGYLIFADLILDLVRVSFKHIFSVLTEGLE